MTSRYQELLDQARKEKINFYYQKVLKQIAADGATDDQTYIGDIFRESIATILTGDQKKSMKVLAKELVKDKALLKEISELIKNA